MPYHLATPHDRIAQSEGPERTPRPSALKLYGVDDGTRTRDTWNHNPVLYRLNYIHHIGEGKILVRQEGLEPPAYCLEGSCSIHLSYWRVLATAQRLSAGGDVSPGGLAPTRRPQHAAAFWSG